MLRHIRKRDGRITEFMSEKIACAIFKAAKACGGNDYALAVHLADQVTKAADRSFSSVIPTVEDIQDLVEKVLIENGHARTAKAYILYREKRADTRNLHGLIMESKRLFTNYLGEKDWRLKENANTQKSINGLNNYIRESLVERYWLHTIYPREVRQVHEDGDAHIHDLGFWGP